MIFQKISKQVVFPVFFLFSGVFFSFSGPCVFAQTVNAEPVRIAKPSEKIRLLENAQFFHALSEKIRSAKHQILIVSFLFKTTASPKNRANRILELLKAAKKRKIDVRVILENSNYHRSVSKENESTLRKLKRSGVSVYQDSPKRTLHSKLVVIDERFVFLGSHNLTNSALKTNNEVSVLIDSKDFARQIERYIQKIQFSPLK